MKKTWIVTGGNTGLGYECTRNLARDPNDLVVIACRDPKKAEQASTTLRQSGGAVQVLALDLSKLSSVRAFVAQFQGANLPPLEGVICNAGSQSVAVPMRTAEGYETTFAVNHLGHYLLTRLLLPRP